MSTENASAADVRRRVPGSRNGLAVVFRLLAARSSARPREALPRATQRVDHRPGDRHPVPVVDVGRLRARREPLQDRAIQGDRGILAPHGIARVLHERDRSRAPGQPGRIGSRDRHDRRLDRHGREVELRLPGELLRGDDRLDHELRRGEEHQRVGPGRLQACDLGDDVGGRQLVGLGGDDLRPPAGERAREATRHVLAELRVLEQHRDLRPRPAGGDVAPQHRALAPVARQEADRPRVPRRRAAEGLRAVAGEELRDLLGVQVVADREVVRGAHRVEDREDPVLLDEAPRQLDGLGRVVGVVVVAVLDLPAVDAALRVDVVEVRLRARGRRCRTPPPPRRAGRCRRAGPSSPTRPAPRAPPRRRHRS